MGYMIDKEVLFIFGIPIYLAVVGIKVFLKKRKGKEVVFIRELVKFGFNIYIFALNRGYSFSFRNKIRRTSNSYF